MVMEKTVEMRTSIAMGLIYQYLSKYFPEVGLKE